MNPAREELHGAIIAAMGELAELVQEEATPEEIEQWRDGLAVIDGALGELGEMVG